MKTLNDLGPAKLLASEQAQIREAADALLFCDDIGDPSPRAACSDVEALYWRLVASDRWSASRAGELADDIYACGPAFDVQLRAA
jgi:hypothetical protein